MKKLIFIFLFLVLTLFCLIILLFYHLLTNLSTNKSEEQPVAVQSHTTPSASANATVTNHEEQAATVQIHTVPSISMDMLWCEPGTFMMGTARINRFTLLFRSAHGLPSGREDDETQHQVTLTKGFYLGKHEVTQEQWEKVMGANPSDSKRATLPAETVSWDDAIKFCEKLTQMEKAAGRLPEGWAYTLPTEAQWEYACRAGTTTAYSFGDTITPKQANYGSNVGKPTPVGTYPANAWGFHDMHGNVYEWCLDLYYPDVSASDPVGPSTFRMRVSRGGSWINDGRNMRSANRDRYTPYNRTNNLGFRLSLQTAKTE